MKAIKLVPLLLIASLRFDYVYSQPTTWLGLNSDFGDPVNWDNGAPDAGFTNTEAIIPDVTSIAAPIINNSSTLGPLFQTEDLTIQAGGTLTIEEDGALEIFGNVDNSGDIIINDNGLFSQTGFLGTYTAQPGSTFSLSRTGTSDPLKFNMWSSPVAAQNVSTFSGNTYSFNPATSTASTADDDNDPGWTIAAGNMIPGKGYAGAGSGTVTFSGTPNNGTFSVPVSYHGGPGVPYNLIGNPYPGPLDINLFLNSGSNPTDLATLSVYLWDNPASTVLPYSTSDYATINALGTILSGGQGTYSSPYSEISTGQGFFVEIDAATDGDLDFNNTLRGDVFSDNSQFYKHAEMQRIWLGVSDNDSTVYNEILVAFTDSATTGFDKKYDAKKLAGNTKLSLYSVNNNRHYAIQGLPYLTKQEVKVPVGVLLDSSNTITFSLKWEEELQDFDIYLEDKQTGSVIDLRNANYTLAIPNGEYNERFSIIMTPKNATGISHPINNGISITHNSGILQISNTQNKLEFLESVVVFDVAGKKIQEWDHLILNNLEKISLPFAPAYSGYYIVNIKGENESVRQKIRIIN